MSGTRSRTCSRRRSSAPGGRPGDHLPCDGFKTQVSPAPTRSCELLDAGSAVTKEAARAAIAARVDGVRIREVRGYYGFTSSGFHLAELSDLTLPDGEQGARLTYRTAMVTPVAATARSKARRIGEAVEEHRHRDG